ncbi:MAG: hypothetical protein ACM3PY_09865 [Omnitrophica WOR_2 bacterium]
MEIRAETVAPTLAFTPTPTILWFPPTATFTPFPTRGITPTPDLRPGLGKIILEDDFSSADNWTLSSTNQGSIALGKHELSVVVSEPKTYLYSVRKTPELSNFYLEITASPNLCQGMDEYGLLLRFSSPGDFYRFSLTCNAQIRLDRIAAGEASSPQTWMISGDVPPGAPSLCRLAVWAQGDELRFFVNDQFQFSVRDPMLKSGNIGVFARSSGNTIESVIFSDLVIKEIHP